MNNVKTLDRKISSGKRMEVVKITARLERQWKIFQMLLDNKEDHLAAEVRQCYADLIDEANKITGMKLPAIQVYTHMIIYQMGYTKERVISDHENNISRLKLYSAGPELFPL